MDALADEMKTLVSSRLLSDYDQALRIWQEIATYERLARELRNEAGDVFKAGGQDDRAMFLRQMAGNLEAKARKAQDASRNLVNIDRMDAIYTELSARVRVEEEGDDDA